MIKISFCLTISSNTIFKNDCTKDESLCMLALKIVNVQVAVTDQNDSALVVLRANRLCTSFIFIYPLPYHDSCHILIQRLRSLKVQTSYTHLLNRPTSMAALRSSTLSQPYPFAMSSNNVSTQVTQIQVQIGLSEHSAQMVLWHIFIAAIILAVVGLAIWLYEWQFGSDLNNDRSAHSWFSQHSSRHSSRYSSRYSSRHSSEDDLSQDYPSQDYPSHQSDTSLHPPSHSSVSTSHMRHPARARTDYRQEPGALQNDLPADADYMMYRRHAHYNNDRPSYSSESSATAVGRGDSQNHTHKSRERRRTALDVEVSPLQKPHRESDYSTLFKHGSINSQLRNRKKTNPAGSNSVDNLFATVKNLQEPLSVYTVFAPDQNGGQSRVIHGTAISPKTTDPNISANSLYNLQVAERPHEQSDPSQGHCPDNIEEDSPYGHAIIGETYKYISPPRPKTTEAPRSASFHHQDDDSSGKGSITSVTEIARHAPPHPIPPRISSAAYKGLPSLLSLFRYSRRKSQFEP